MITRTLPIALLLAAFIGTSLPAQAGGKKKGAGAASGRVVGRFDRNGDGKVDGQEAERMKTVYASLAALDTDHNGQLSDSEISAAKVVAGKKKKSSSQ